MNFRRRRLAVKILLTVFMATISIIMLLPFAWMLSASFKPSNEIFAFPVEWIPSTITFEHYAQVWTLPNVPFALFYLNSIKVTVLSVLGEVITSALAAYAFAKIKFRGSDVIFLIYISTLIFPGQMLLIPRFVLFSEIGLYNTHWALILPGMFTAFGTFMLRQFFMSIPEELSESARMDGANHFIIFSRIVVPLSMSAFSALIIFQFVTMWNEYESALVYLRDMNLATIPLGLKFYQDENSASYGAVMAASCCALVPVFIIFLVFQKHFVAGIATSGMKE